MFPCEKMLKEGTFIESEHQPASESGTNEATIKIPSTQQQNKFIENVKK